MVVPSVLVVGDPDEELDRIFDEAGLVAATDSESPALIAAHLSGGGERLGELRRRHPDAEIVLLVPAGANVPARSVARALRAEILTLPPDRRRTLETLRRALDRHGERTRHREVVERVRRLDPEVAGTVAALVRESEERRRAFDEAVQLRSSFIANISHEIRTPVTVMQGMLEILAEDLEGRLSPEDHDLLERVRVSGENLLELVQGILDLSKADAGVVEIRPGRVYVPDFVADLVRSVEPLTVDKPVRLLVDLPRGIEWITVDGPKLHQLLVNLLSNAAKFTERGEIRLALRLIGGEPIETDAASLVRAPAPSGDTLEITVTDTGRGISTADQELIFEAFRQVDLSAAREHEGIGIGLTLVREMARLLQASLQLESRDGEGTTFRVRLPVAALSAEAPPPVAPRRAVVTGARRARESRDLVSELARLFRAPLDSPADAVTFVLDFADRVLRPDVTCFARPSERGWSIVDSLGSDAAAGAGSRLPLSLERRGTPAREGTVTRVTDDEGREWWLAPLVSETTEHGLLAVAFSRADAPDDTPALLTVAARWLGLELEREALGREKTEIVAAIGRDVKTPLGNVLAYTQSLLRNLCGPISAEQRVVVLRIERALHRAILSTLDLLDYQRARARGLAGVPGSFSLAKVLDHLLSRHMAAIELGAYQVRKEIPDDLPDCHGDEIRTDRSISNLMRALIDRLPNASEIRIQATADEESVRCDISAAPSDLAPFLDGLGPETRPPEIGEMLGLRITRAGIESQGGRVELLQGVNDLTVRVSLPRAKGDRSDP